MKKIKCPKCRRILLTYEDNVEKGKLIINVNCPDCKSMSIVTLNTDAEHNSKEYLGKMNHEGNEFLR